MTTDFDDPWNQFTSIGSSFQSWIKHGDTLTGEIVSRGLGVDYMGQPCPEFVVKKDDGELVTVTAGQVNLKKQVIDMRDELVPGNRVQIKYVADEQSSRGQYKVFEIKAKASTATETKAKAKKEPVTVPAAEPETTTDDF